MTTTARSVTVATWVCVTLLAVSTLAMWLPALHTPFWGDDYVFLLKAHASHLSAAPWWSDFWPHSPVQFWRPLSQEGYWRLMEAGFGGSALAMHVTSLVLHVLASASVGVLALGVARACAWPRARLTAALAGVLYATLSMHMLPVHWAAAANNSMLTVFTALALSAWIVAPRVPGARRTLLFAAIPALLTLALLTKESAVLIPGLMVLVGGFVGHRRWSRDAILVLAACGVVIVVWLVLDARFTAHMDAAYAFVLGTNVLRNTMTLMAWMMNVPRESLRMAMLGDIGTALVWIAATAAPMLAAWLMVLRRGHAVLTRRQWLVVVLFVGLAYGPYFLFSWNSYAYYAAVAAMLPMIVLAHLATRVDRVWCMAALVAFSSWVAVAGTRHAGQPSLIARARWGDNLLRHMERHPVVTPLWVQVRDQRRFYAVGKAGLAWHLGIPPQAIHLARQCPARALHCLIIGHDDDWHWRPMPHSRQKPGPREFSGLQHGPPGPDRQAPTHCIGTCP